MSESTKLRNEIRASRIALAEISRAAGVPLTTLHAFVRKDGAEMRTSNFEKVSEALASLQRGRPASPHRGVGEEGARFVAGEQVTITLTVSSDQARLLRGAGADVVSVARAGAERALKEAEAKAWADANREAIDASSAWIEKYGTFAEQLGLI